MSHKTLRFAALTLAWALLLTVFSSCGKNEKQYFVMKTYSTFGEENDLAAYSEIVSEYTKNHKNVMINDTTTTQSNSYKMALSIASTYRGANSPDVVYFSAISDMSELSDFFMTVDEIRADYPKFAKGISEAALDSVAANDGGRYCIPVRGDWQGIVVNAALFRRSSLNIPTSWEDIIRAANHFEKGDVYLFANSLDESSALMEYLVRSLGGMKSVRSAMNGNPDDCWAQALEAVEQLDELGAFPGLPQEAFDYLVSASDLKNTTAEELPSAVELYNSENAAILLIDNTMCGSINADIDSQYIALPQFGTFTAEETTTAGNSYPTNAVSGPVYPKITVNTLPPSQAPDSGSGETSAPAAESTTETSSASSTEVSSTEFASAAQTETTTAPSESTAQLETTVPVPVSPSDEQEEAAISENGLYVNFAEGFYITKKAYYDTDKREDILAFVEAFLQEKNCIKLCGSEYRVPALTSISHDSEDKLTDKSNIYNAVINSVQSADSFLVTAQTQENQFFWNHCSMAVAYLSKGMITKEETLRLISDTQITVADIFNARAQ